MKKFISVILAAVLVMAVSTTFINETIADFSDVEFSMGNRMKAANKKNDMNLVISGGPIVVEHAMPCCWKEEVFTLINAGEIDGTASIHIKDLICYEDAPGEYWQSTDPWIPVPANATSEPEGVAEEGGWFDVLIPPPIPGNTPKQNLAAGHALGVDTCNLADYIDVRIWFDENNDCDFDDPGELWVEGILSDLDCIPIELGFIPAPTQINGGWGTYFEYIIGSATEAMPLAIPLIANKHDSVGEVWVWDDGVYLYVKYGPTSNDFLLEETHVYAGTLEPPTVGWGKFPYTDGVEHLGGLNEYLYTISLTTEIVTDYIDGGKPKYTFGGVTDGDTVYIAAHAQDTDGDTGWGMGGQSRKLKIELHFPNIFDKTYTGDPHFADWATNAYQGDYCTFDIEFELLEPDS